VDAKGNHLHNLRDFHFESHQTAETDQVAMGCETQRRGEVLRQHLRTLPWLVCVQVLAGLTFEVLLWT
jgi:hypothetical protein